MNGREIRVSGSARDKLHAPAGTGCAFELRKRVLKIPLGAGKHKKKRPALRAGRQNRTELGSTCGFLAGGIINVPPLHPLASAISGGQEARQRQLALASTDLDSSISSVPKGR